MCGNCCRGEGFVRVTPAEIARIAGFLDVDPDEFRRAYTREPEIAEHSAAGDLWLTEKHGLDCVFLEGNLCAINPVKPAQCHGFPLKWRTPDVMDYCVGMQS
jgi:uncharacterized protein